MSDKCVVENGKTKYSVYTADKFKQLLVDLGANITTEIETLLASGKCIVRNGNRKYSVYTAKRVDEILSNLNVEPELSYETKTLTTNKDVVDSDLADYPVLVRLDSSNYNFSKSRDDGYDIQFYIGSVQLSHETVVFDKANEKALYYVKIPNLSSTSNIEVEMRYGDKDISIDTSNKNDVWSNSYIGVWHLGYSLEDSTGNGNDGVNDGSTVVDGLNGKARSFDGSNDYINLGNNASIKNLTKNFTIQAFAKPNTVNIGQTLVDKVTDNASKQYTLSLASDDMNTQYEYNGNNYSFTSSNNAVTTEYQSFTLTIDNSLLISHYLNGNINGSGTAPHETTIKSDDVYIGARIPYYNSSHFDGIIEEIQMRNVDNSASWNKADYHNLIANDLISIS